MAQRERLAALEQLLAVPDPFDRCRRATVTQPGDPGRHALLVPQASVYRTWVLVEERENGRARAYEPGP